MKVKNKLFIILIVFCVVVMMSCSIAIVFAASNTGIDVNNSSPASFTYSGTLKLNELDDGTYSVAGWTGSGELKIPDEYNGKPITNIAAGAFAFNEDITKVTLGENITTIGDEAFNTCSNLTSVDFNEKLTTVGDSAFYNCDSLTSIDLSPASTIVSIGDYCFNKCSSLETIVLDPIIFEEAEYDGTLQYIGVNALLVAVDDDDYLIDGRNVSFVDKDGNELITGNLIKTNTGYIHIFNSSGTDRTQNYYGLYRTKSFVDLVYQYDDHYFQRVS